jgi:hypothetical protein
VAEPPIRLLYQKPPGKPIRWLESPWGDILSILVTGQSSSGKSWAVVNLCVRAVRQGMKLIVADPHSGNSESLVVRLRPLELTGCFRKEPYRGLDNVKAAFDWFSGELHRRMQRASEYEEATRAPGGWTLETDHDDRILLVVDEFNQVLRERKMREPVLKALTDLVQAGRKYGLYAVVLGQWASVDALGSEVRGCFPSKLVMRMSPAWAARILSVPLTEVGMAGKLYRGEGYLMLADGPYSDRPWYGRVPKLSIGHVEMAAREIARLPRVAAVLEPTLTPRQRVNPELRAELEGQAERALWLLAEGRTLKEVMAVLLPGRTLEARTLSAGYRVMEDILRPVIVDHLQRQERVVA